MSLQTSVRHELHELGVLLYDSATIGANPATAHEFASWASEQDRPVVQRLAIRGLTYALQHGGQSRLEKLATRAYKGEQVLGLGHQSVVLADGDHSVRKIMHRTYTKTTEEQVAHATRLEKRQALLVDAFGDRVLAQRFTVEPFPPNPAHTCVTAYQARVINGTPSNMFAPSPVALDYLAECRDLYDRTGIMPDIVGVGNTLETTNGITLVDTIPLSVRVPDDGHTLKLAHAIFAMHNIGDGLPVA